MMRKTAKQIPTEALPFLDRLTLNMERFSAGQRQIADCLLNDPDAAAFWNAATLAQRAKVSEATAVRFAQFLGYEGFPELRVALAAETQTRIQKQARFLEVPQDAASTLVEVARRDVANIQRSLSQINQTLMESAVSRLQAARRIALVGRGISSHMAELLGYLLALAGLPTLSGHGLDFTHQIANLDAQDLLVAFSFHPYSRETIEAAQFAKNRNVPILAFSDRLDAPLGKLATLTLTVPGENLLYSHSMVAFAVLANALVTSIAAKHPNQSLTRLRDAERAAAPDYVPER